MPDTSGRKRLDGFLSRGVSIDLEVGRTAHSDTSDSDIDILVVANNTELEQIYAVLMPVEQMLGRRLI